MSETPHRYDRHVAHSIEPRWQRAWTESRVFEAANPAGPWATDDISPDHVYVLDMFPYPSGVGLHIGHPTGYTATDAYARFQRALGKNVLHTMGFDAFGLPAEHYAVQTGQHPRVTTERNIETMTRQLTMMGYGHDPRRRISTIDPDYIRWTQWIFTQIYNSWYDADAERPDGGRGAARPISTLTAQYEAGVRHTPDGRPWAELSAAEREEVLSEHRLAYVSEAPVNWCPGLGTVLANEEVTNEGRSERGDFPVFRRNLRQWMMRITSYSDRLAADLDRVEWPEKIKLMQRNWIGRSVGARVRFELPTVNAEVEVFTTRPDTLFGATFMVVAPEHPLVERLSDADAWPDGTDPRWTGGETSPRAAVTSYRLAASRKSDVERQTEGKDKTGVFTGAYAVNPANGSRLPVFVADYVLMGYGTGAIMAVPAEDERDWDFATAFGLPIVRTVQPPEGHPEDQAWTGDGPTINSANDEVDLNGLPKAEASAAMTAWLDSRGYGAAAVSYKLRDWLFSRQRYWGEPFPIVYDADGVAHTLPDEMLPVTLPDVADYSPQTFDPQDSQSSPSAPLTRATDWTTVELDLGNGLQTYTRETNTMPNWAGSCWYYLRYLDPANSERFCDPEVERYWVGPRDVPVAGAPAGARDPGGVDLYVGGAEHAVLHLLYARFWHKVLYDLGHVSSEEPFRTYFANGMLLGWVYRDERGVPVPAAEVEEVVGPDGTSYVWEGQPVTREMGKLGKSLKNGVDPDDIVAEHGADTLRVYLMSLGPLDVAKPWDSRAVVGAARFLQRVWRLVVDETTGETRVTDGEPDRATTQAVARTVEGVRADFTALRWNTGIAKLIELTNHLTKQGSSPRAAVEALVVMLAPLAPHVAEELWARLGHSDLVARAPFPVADPALLVADVVTAIVQVQGKVKDRIEVTPDISEDDLRARALASPKVAAAMAGREIRTVIVRAPHLVNVVPA